MGEVKLKKESQMTIIGNIEKLMDAQKIKPTKLAKETKIPQSTISKGLSRSGGTNFSIENICKIAEYFEVSVDFLLGRNKAKSDSVSNKEICRQMMRLIESGAVTVIERDVEEDAYLPIEYPVYENMYPYEYKRIKSKYKMFYFSNYDQLPDPECLDDVEKDEITDDCLIYGTENKKGKELNSFLDYYLKFLDLYKKNDLPRDMFDTAIEDRLSQMKY